MVGFNCMRSGAMLCLDSEGLGAIESDEDALGLLRAGYTGFAFEKGPCVFYQMSADGLRHPRRPGVACIEGGGERWQ